MISKGHLKTLHFKTPRGTATLALMLIFTLVATACSGGSASTPGTPVAGSTAAPAQAGSSAGAATPQGGKKNGSLDCQAIVNAAFDLNTGEPFMIALAGAGGSIVNRVDSPAYVDTAKLRKDLDVLAALPDPTDALTIKMMGKPSEAILQFRQLFDLIDKAASANPAAGSTPSPSGLADQQLLDFGARFVKMSLAINSAVGDACPNTSVTGPGAGLPNAPATPLTAGYRIGQTAPVGDLRVTLDKVVTLFVANTMFLTPGNRYVFAYFTVENTGKTAFQMNVLGSTHWEDAAGKQYGFDPNTIMLNPDSTNFDGGLDPGVKKSGAEGYQLPTDAGDMVWVFQDYKPNRAVFAVKASDIGAMGTPVTAPTAQAMQQDAAATQTAFMGMAVEAAATQDAAGTETPAPTDTPATP